MVFSSTLIEKKYRKIANRQIFLELLSQQVGEDIRSDVTYDIEEPKENLRVIVNKTLKGTFQNNRLICSEMTIAHCNELEDDFKGEIELVLSNFGFDFPFYVICQNVHPSAVIMEPNFFPSYHTKVISSGSYDAREFLNNLSLYNSCLLIKSKGYFTLNNIPEDKMKNILPHKGANPSQKAIVQFIREMNLSKKEQIEIYTQGSMLIHVCASKRCVSFESRNEPIIIASSKRLKALLEEEIKVDRVLKSTVFDVDEFFQIMQDTRFVVFLLPGETLLFQNIHPEDLERIFPDSKQEPLLEELERFWFEKQLLPVHNLPLIERPKFAEVVVDKESRIIAYKALDLGVFLGPQEKLLFMDKKYRNPELAVILAAKEGDLEALRIFNSRSIFLQKQNEKGQTALMVAAKQGHLACVEFLAKMYTDLDQKDKEGNTAAMHATKGNHARCLEVLGDFGADLKLKNLLGDSPLVEAALERYKDCLDVLSSKGICFRLSEEAEGSK